MNSFILIGSITTKIFNNIFFNEVSFHKFKKKLSLCLSQSHSLQLHVPNMLNLVLPPKICVLLKQFFGHIFYLQIFYLMSHLFDSQNIEKLFLKCEFNQYLDGISPFHRKPLTYLLLLSCVTTIKSRKMVLPSSVPALLAMAVQKHVLEKVGKLSGSFCLTETCELFYLYH